MGTLILIRHGESLWNRAGKYQGKQNIGLSPEGIRQAEALARFFSSWHLDAIYASDLVRARDTAAAIAKYHSLPVTVDTRLREYAFGVWEGLTRKEIELTHPEIFEKRKHDINTPIPGGETGTQVQRRVMDWLQEIASAYSGSVLAVSHGGAIRTLIAAILEVEITKCHRLRLANGGYTIIRWQENTLEFQFDIERINCSPLLQQL